MKSVWLSHRSRDPADPSIVPHGFKVEWYSGPELRCRWFPLYRDAVVFADRKAGRTGCVVDEVSPDLRKR